MSYKPGFDIHLLRSSAAPYVTLRLCRLRLNADAYADPELQAVIQNTSLTEWHLEILSPREFMQWVRQAIIKFERYEIDEWLRVDGVRVTPAREAQP